MSKFHFHVRDGHRLIEDPNEADLSDLDAARAVAADALRWATTVPHGAAKAASGRRFEITDGAGRILATVALRDAVKPH